MAEDQRKALIRQGPRSIGEVGAGARGILASIVSDALALARSHQKSLAAARFRVGDYEFCDPDYRQILVWAEALKIDPEKLIRRLEVISFERFDDDDNMEEIITFTVENGTIASLAWDFDALPITKFDWVDGLFIRALILLGRPVDQTEISFCLPSLRRLFMCGYRRSRPCIPI